MHSMLKKDFWYDLPKELIAQEPASPRDAARLMVLSQKDDSIQHKVFRDLPEFLEPGDLLVVNNSKVLPARIVGVKQPTGAVCELLLLRQVKGDQWECLAKPGKRMQPGTKVSFGDGSLTAVVDETMEDGNKYVTFYYDTETLYEKLDEFGKMPLPPYITKQLEDQSQYQTVYAKELGSAAAPTAGLHFTPELMDTIRAMGVGIAEVTLHVGLGTFRPVQEDVDGFRFECVDKGFEDNEAIEVVLRPEDLDIVEPDQAKIRGTVRNITFKGVHYEILVETELRTYMVHTTDYAEVGREVGLKFGPEDIHVMCRMGGY